MNDNQPSWPSAVVALGFLALVGVVFISIYQRGGIDDALKAWGAVGTVVGVIVGAIPTYFFHQIAKQEQQNANALRLAADDVTIQKARTLGLRM